NPIIPGVDYLRNGFRRSWKVQQLTDPFIEKLLGWARHRFRAGFQSPGERVTDLALDWLDRLSPPRRPWVLFLYFLDPLNPDRPPPGERGELPPGVNPSTLPCDTKMFNPGRLPITPQAIAARNGLYDGEIHAMDAAVGRLFSELARRGYGPSNLVIIVTADHG